MIGRRRFRVAFLPGILQQLLHVDGRGRLDIIELGLHVVAVNGGIRPLGFPREAEALPFIPVGIEDAEGIVFGFFLLAAGLQLKIILPIIELRTGRRFFLLFRLLILRLFFPANGSLAHLLRARRAHLSAAEIQASAQSVQAERDQNGEQDVTAYGRDQRHDQPVQQAEQPPAARRAGGALRPRAVACGKIRPVPFRKQGSGCDGVRQKERENDDQVGKQPVFRGNAKGFPRDEIHAHDDRPEKKRKGKPAEHAQ